MRVRWKTVPPPLVAGGTGGSGTRVVTEILSAANVFMGSRVNRSGDALWLADFDWRWGKPYLAAELARRRAPLLKMRVKLDACLHAHLSGYDPALGAWGWKHPHSYLLLPWLDARIPELKFVHVVRDGRYIACSSNQKQLQRYGEVALGARAPRDSDEVRSIRFWSWANERAADYGQQRMGARYLRVRFEDVCADPHGQGERLIAFALGSAPSAETVARAAALVKAPPPAHAPADEPAASEVERAGADALRRFGYLW